MSEEVEPRIIFQEDGDFKAGALIPIDKPLKWTSFDVVNKIRWCLKRDYGKIKVGHCGTLDPLATGLVLVCTGKWTKRIEEYMADEKEYVATLKFGETTPSYDMETSVNAVFPYEHISRDVLDGAIEKFIGDISQIPPVFSAIRVDGKRAYESARKGNDIDMQARKVFVKSIDVIKFDMPTVTLKIVCGKGTYIRSIANDLGVACGSGAHLSGLVRTGLGEFRLENANKMDEVVAFLQK